MSHYTIEVKSSNDAWNKLQKDLEVKESPKITIETGVPLPPANNRERQPDLNRQIIDAFAEMEIGDSFLIPSSMYCNSEVELNNLRSRIQGKVIKYNKTLTKEHIRDKYIRISTRKQSDGLHIWRVN
jgi:hypothetical protein